MSDTLDYSTTSGVPDEIRRAIHEDLSRIKHPWWCEGISFQANGSSGAKITGNTKLFLVGYSEAAGDFVDVDPDDDSLMAWRDAQFIIEVLTRWGSEHDLKWEISYAGEQVGKIVHGKPDHATVEFLASLRKMSSLENTHEVAERALTKYKNRG